MIYRYLPFLSSRKPVCPPSISNGGRRQSELSGIHCEYKNFPMDPGHQVSPYKNLTVFKARHRFRDDELTFARTIVDFHQDDVFRCGGGPAA
jgi:hypothetical protein